jgi:hypothetical protein
MVTGDDGVLRRLSSIRRTGQSRTGSEQLYAMRLCVVQQGRQYLRVGLKVLPHNRCAETSPRAST